ncbi:hypothetical protein Tco_1247559, partial [Tanacetum coccineum]
VAYVRVAMCIGWTNEETMRVGIMVRKEAQMGFLSKDGKDLRPADLLLLNWLQVKDACLDVTSISPFAGMGANSWPPMVALHNVVEKKRKYASKCADNGYKFIPIAFSTFGEFNKDALDTLSRIKSLSIGHSNYVKSGAFIFHREAKVTFKRMGIWFVLYDLTKPHVPSSLEQLDHVDDLVQVQYGGFTLALLDSLFSKGLRTVKFIHPKCHLGFSRVLKEALDKVICTPDDISSWVSLPCLGERNIKQCKKKICDGHYTLTIRVFFSYGVAPSNDATLVDLKTKQPFKPTPSLPHIPIDHHHLVASPLVVLDRIKSFPHVSSITQVVNVFHEGKCLKMLGEYIASVPLTPLVKLSGGICPIAIGSVWRRLVFKVSVVMIVHSLDGYLDDLQFGVGASEGSEAILYAVNRLIEDRGDDFGLLMLLVDFKMPSIWWIERLCYGKFVFIVLLLCVGWNSVSLTQLDLLHPLIRKITDSFSLSQHAWYLDDGTIIGDTLVVGKVLELIMEEGPSCGLHLNVDKTEVFLSKEDPRSRLAGSELVMKIVAKTIVLMDTVARVNDPRCELLLLRAYAGISKLCFGMHTCSPRVFEMAKRSFDAALCSALLQSAGLQTKLLRHSGIVTSGPTFDDALCVFNTKMKIGLLSNPSEIMENHTSDWLRVVLISNLGQTMIACSRVFRGDIYGDHVVSCACIIRIKHWHNVVRDTLVDIYFRSGISAGKEVDTRLGGGRDKPLRPTDMLLYSWDTRLDVCVDLTGSSPLTQTGMVDFVPVRAVIDAAHCKRVKYEGKCSYIGYGFLSFSFSLLRELEKDAVALLRRIRKFSVTQDIGARAAVYIFN